MSRRAVSSRVVSSRAVAVAAGVCAALLAGCGGTPGEPGPAPLEQLTARARPAAGGSPAPPPAPAPSPDGTSPAPEPSPTGVPAPTLAGLGRFLAGFAPEGASGLEHVAVDLDGDDVEEAVVTWVAGGRVHVAVVVWGPADGYAVRAVDQGGAAARVVAVRVGDLTADGAPELVVEHRGDGRSGLSLWQVASGRALVRSEAVGGCAAGHVYGVVGATLRRVGDAVEIVATCDDSPLPVADWSSDVYRFRDGAWRVVEPPAPQPSPTPTPVPTPPGPTPDPTTGG